MAKDLHELIERNPELFKTAMRLPTISKRVLAMITGIQKWGERSKISVKQIIITGPTGPVGKYDTSFKISRRRS